MTDERAWFELLSGRVQLVSLGRMGVSIFSAGVALVGRSPCNGLIYLSVSLVHVGPGFESGVVGMIQYAFWSPCSWKFEGASFGRDSGLQCE